MSLWEPVDSYRNTEYYKNRQGTFLDRHDEMLIN